MAMTQWSGHPADKGRQTLNRVPSAIEDVG